MARFCLRILGNSRTMDILHSIVWTSNRPYNNKKKRNSTKQKVGRAEKLVTPLVGEILIVAYNSVVGVTLRQSITMGENQVTITGRASLQWTCGLGATARRCDASAHVDAALAD